MYNNPFQNYNQQLEREKLDAQIAKLQQMRDGLNQPVQPSINQTFQLAPQGGMKFVNSIEDVKKDIVYIDTPYFSHDLSVMWVKNNKGDIKSFELKEIVQKDQKDVIIDSLQIQLDEMSKKIKELEKNAKPINEYIDEPIESEKSASVPKSRTTKK